jgi:tRNA-dihydrouridine synthase 1
MCYVGARDGAAKLEYVKEVKKRLKIPVIANGNVITFDDIVRNMEFTGADGIMTAEGILDDPAIFNRGFEGQVEAFKQRRKVEKKLREIEALEARADGKLNSSEVAKVSKKLELTMELEKLPPVDESKVERRVNTKLGLAMEYLQLAKEHPVKMKSIIFHIRRIIKDELTDYQLMADCTSCSSLEQVESIVKQCISYKEKNNFVYDPLKEQKMREAIERRKWEEGKRKRFEERMIRKAKREGKDQFFFLNEGSAPPTIEKLEILKSKNIYDVWYIYIY